MQDRADPSNTESADTPTGGKGGPAPQDDLYRRMFKGHDDSRHKRRIWAASLADLLTEDFRPASVVDVGCGLGFFLSAMGARGARELRGVDADWVTGQEPEISRDAYVLHDLSLPYGEERRYDLAACLEVAEHLPRERGPGLVADLARLSDRILFSAAIPGQEGAGHINCRWQSYWARLFRDAGYRIFDPYRRRVLGNPDVAPWFQQNLLLFLKDGTEIPAAIAPSEIEPPAADLVTRHFHQEIMGKQRRALEAATDQLKEAGMRVRPPAPPRRARAAQGPDAPARRTETISRRR